MHKFYTIALTFLFIQTNIICSDSEEQEKIHSSSDSEKQPKLQREAGFRREKTPYTKQAGKKRLDSRHNRTTYRLDSDEEPAPEHDLMVLTTQEIETIKKDFKRRYGLIIGAFDTTFNHHYLQTVSHILPKNHNIAEVFFRMTCDRRNKLTLCQTYSKEEIAQLIKTDPNNMTLDALDLELTDQESYHSTK